MQLWLFINNTICLDWYLNWGPLDLQSNTLPLCHQGCWHLVLITSVITCQLCHKPDGLLVIYLLTVGKFPWFEIVFPAFGWKTCFSLTGKFSKFSLRGGNPVHLNRKWTHTHTFSSEPSSDSSSSSSVSESSMSESLLLIFFLGFFFFSFLPSFFPRFLVFPFFPLPEDDRSRQENRSDITLWISPDFTFLVLMTLEIEMN